MQPLRISAFTATSGAGTGVEDLWQALVCGRTGLAPNDFADCTLDTQIGRVPGIETESLPAELQRWDARNNRLAALGLRQDGFLDQVLAARDRHGPHRVGLVLGTSTASIASTEAAYRARTGDTALPAPWREPVVHSPYSLVGFVKEYLGLGGPAYGISTACSSSARVFGSAHRLLATGRADAVVVGGVDSLCLSILYGFHSLELMSSTACRPFDTARDGLSIGEGAGFALLERLVTGSTDTQGPLLVGYGDASDAHHMSSPHPEGLGARLAMDEALRSSCLHARDVDYVNLHGTATRANDRVETDSMRRVFAEPVACSSTKGWTGHTLGAAGIVEAVVTLLCLRRGFVPGTLHCREPEPGLAAYLRLESEHRPLRHAMSNSFGFGGNNCSLIFAA